MINILLGVLITVLFFLCLAVSFYLGFKLQKKAVIAKLSEEEKEEQERRIKGLQNVLDYDYDVAIGKRVQK